MFAHILLVKLFQEWRHCLVVCGLLRVLDSCLRVDGCVAFGQTGNIEEALALPPELPFLILRHESGLAGCELDQELLDFGERLLVALEPVDT